MSTLTLHPETHRLAKTLLAAVLELRSRAFKMIHCLLGVFVCLYPFADQVFHVVAQPMIAAMPVGSSLISKQVASPFLTPLRATFYVALRVLKSKSPGWYALLGLCVGFGTLSKYNYCIFAFGLAAAACRRRM